MPEQRDYLDPVRLARWLKTNREVTRITVEDSVVRRLFAWEYETKRPVYVASETCDEILTVLDVHEHELPDRLWAKAPECLRCDRVLTGADPRRKRCPGC